MSLAFDPEVVEPLEPTERCDSAYGNYHIGRENEARGEFALVFALDLLAHPEFIERQLQTLVHEHDGRILFISEFEASEPDMRTFSTLFGSHGSCTPSFWTAQPSDVAVMVAELRHPSIDSIDGSLRAYTSYFGYGDVSWPSHFRTIVSQRREFM